MKHPLHKAVASIIIARIPAGFELVSDPACGGIQHLPLFIGQGKAIRTRMCCVDILVIRDGKVHAIVEIEESGFIPSKICGKFLQAALANHFIHDTRTEGPISYGENVLFIQVLDGSKCLKTLGQKDSQAELIRNEIRKLLPIRGVKQYELFFVKGEGDIDGLSAVGDAIFRALDKQAS